jgi:hypothetical protein
MVLSVVSGESAATASSSCAYPCIINRLNQTTHSLRHCTEAWVNHGTVMALLVKRYGVHTMLHSNVADGSTGTFLQHSLMWACVCMALCSPVAGRHLSAYST